MFVQKSAHSDIVVVTDAAAKKELPKDREWGYLELRDENNRKAIDHLCSKLLNSLELKTGGITLGRMDVVKIQRWFIKQFAYQLLGNDWSYEALC